jgi:hypothetical protein
MPRPIKSGRNRQRVLLFDVPENAVDSWGQPSNTPVQIVNPGAVDGGFWAEVRPLRGSEMLNVRQIWALATHIVSFRWLGSTIPVSADNPNGRFMPQMKIQLLLDNSILNIEFADNVEKRNRRWELICSSHVGATT